MDVSIQEQSFSFGVRYVIETPASTWTASKKILSLLPNITLNASDGLAFATIHGEIAFLSRFRIEFADGRVYEYHSEKLWKGVDMCEGSNGSFHIYRHKGVSYSIFQEEKQIAALTRNKLIVGNGKSYDLRVNADVDLPLIVSMVLCLNTKDGDDQEDATVTYDFGSLGPEDRKFDDSWRPTE